MMKSSIFASTSPRHTRWPAERQGKELSAPPAFQRSISEEQQAFLSLTFSSQMELTEQLRCLQSFFAGPARS